MPPSNPTESSGREDPPSQATPIRSDYCVDVGDNFVLPEGSAKKGKKLFVKYCMQCHSIDPDNRINLAGQIPVGPSLFNVCGKVSTMAFPGLVKKGLFSEEEVKAGLVWTDAAFMNYMKHPRVMVGQSGQLQFNGINDLGTRVDIIHYLHTLNHDNQELAGPKAQPPGTARRLLSFVTGMGSDKETQ